MNIKQLKRLIGMHIKILRNKRELTQEELAVRAHLHTTFIAHIEAGKKTPSLNTLVKICNIFQVPVYTIFIPMNRRMVRFPLDKPEKQLLNVLRNRLDVEKYLIAKIARCIFKTSRKTLR